MSSSSSATSFPRSGGCRSTPGCGSGAGRLLGKNKTVRGVLVLVCATTCWTVLLEIGRAGLGGSDRLLLADYGQIPVGAWGALLGLGYVLGELPNSFLKRRLGIRPGAPAPGMGGPGVLGAGSG